MTRAQTRSRQYAKACKLCKTAPYPPNRAVVFGTALWLHDRVTACKATELREKHHEEDRKKSA